MLSDQDIRIAMHPQYYQTLLLDSESIHPLEVRPTPEDWQFQPASLELTLSATFRDLYGHVWTASDPADPQMIHPGQMLLGSTIEYVKIPNWLAARAEGKSSLGRRGLAVHITAGFIDPGFEGQITLELVNHGPKSIVLTPGMPICQLALFRLSSRAARPYGHPDLKSHYQGQTGPTVARA